MLYKATTEQISVTKETGIITAEFWAPSEQLAHEMAFQMLHRYGDMATLKVEKE